MYRTSEYREVASGHHVVTGPGLGAERYTEEADVTAGAVAMQRAAEFVPPTNELGVAMAAQIMTRRSTEF
jgi:hypothetical protein